MHCPFYIEALNLSYAGSINLFQGAVSNGTIQTIRPTFTKQGGNIDWRQQEHGAGINLYLQ